MTETVHGARLTGGTHLPVRDLQHAWTALGVVPVGFLASIGAGELAKAMLGYPGVPLANLSFEFVAPVTAAAASVFLTPCAAAWTWGRRAVRRGERGGWGPALLAALVAASYLSLDLFALALV